MRIYSVASARARESIPTKKSRAWIQLAFGQAQVIGASIGLGLLLYEGVTKKTLAVVAITLLASLTGRLWFHQRNQQSVAKKKSYNYEADRTQKKS